MGEPRRVILADDHAIFLQGLKALLALMDDIDVVATASCGSKTLELIRSKQPDIAVLDGAMPGMAGVEVVEEVRQERLPVQFVLLTMFSHRQLLADALEAGVSACVSKKDAASELHASLNALDDADVFVSTSLLPLMAEIEAGNVQGLTRRERQIMQCIVGGMTNKEISSQLGIAVKTVDTHRERMMRKIGAHNSADVVRYAMQMGVGVL